MASQSVHVSADGMLYIGESSDTGFSGFGAMLAGDSFLLSEFIEGVPRGDSVRFSDNRLYHEIFEGRSRSVHELVPSSAALEHVSEFLRKMDGHIVRVEDLSLIMGHCSDDDGSSETVFSWDALVPSRYWVRCLESIEEFGWQNSDMLTGYIGGSAVFLNALPSRPPVGSSEVMKGVFMRNRDVWYRRFERLVSCSDEYPNSVLRPVGMYQHEGKCYVVSIPLRDSTVMSEFTSFASSEESIDSNLEIIHAMAVGVQFVHSVGITFNGSISHRLFLLSTEGTVLLNTGHLLAHHVDSRFVFGGIPPVELRFLSPRRMQTLSVPLKIASRMLHVEESISFSPQVADDLYSFGRLLAGASKSLPFPWLSHAQYTLVSLLDARAWLSPLCVQPVSLQGGETPEHCDPSDLTPIEKLSHRLMEGQIGVDELIECVEKYFAWRDQTLAGSSVETEVKAVFSKMSSLFQTSQGLFKQAVELSW